MHSKTSTSDRSLESKGEKTFEVEAPLEDYIVLIVRRSLGLPVTHHFNTETGCCPNGLKLWEVFGDLKHIKFSLEIIKKRSSQVSRPYLAILV